MGKSEGQIRDYVSLQDARIQHLRRAAYAARGDALAARTMINAARNDARGHRCPAQMGLDAAHDHLSNVVRMLDAVLASDPRRT